jgi:quercetin dioxygenase-like cupin family protein
MSNIEDLYKENVGKMEFDANIIHHFSDGLYAKQFQIPKNCVIGQHKHTYSHLSILSKGIVNLITDDYNRTYIAPACIEIKAGINHIIHALEDSDWFCIHHTDEKDISKIDEVIIRKD